MFLEELIPDLGHNQGPSLEVADVKEFTAEARIALIFQAFENKSLSAEEVLIRAHNAVYSIMGEIMGLSIAKLGERLRIKKAAKVRALRDGLEADVASVIPTSYNRPPIVRYKLSESEVTEAVKAYRAQLKSGAGVGPRGTNGKRGVGLHGTNGNPSIGTHGTNGVAPPVPIGTPAGTHGTNGIGTRRTNTEVGGPLGSNARKPVENKQVQEIARKSGASPARHASARVEDKLKPSSLPFSPGKEPNSPPLTPPSLDFSSEGSYALHGGRLVCSDQEWAMWVRQGFAEGERERVLIEVLGALYDTDMKGGPAKLHRKASMLLARMLRDRKEKDHRYNKAAKSREKPATVNGRTPEEIQDLLRRQKIAREKAERGEF